MPYIKIEMSLQLCSIQSRFSNIQKRFKTKLNNIVYIILYCKEAQKYQKILT